MLCKRCGAKVPNEALFCVHCGCSMDAKLVDGSARALQGGEREGAVAVQRPSYQHPQAQPYKPAYQSAQWQSLQVGVPDAGVGTAEKIVVGRGPFPRQVKAKKQKGKRGLLIGLGCVGVLVLLLVGIWFLSRDTDILGRSEDTLVDQTVGSLADDSTDILSGDPADDTVPSATEVDGIVLEDVEGEGIRDAARKVRGQGLTVEVRKEYHATVEKGRVIKQDPAPGTILQPDELVIITVCLGESREVDITVFFDANGGEVDPLKVEHAYGDPYGSLPIPTREGYTFDGWYTEQDGGSRVWNNTEILSITEDHILFAHWISEDDTGSTGD